MMKVINEIKIYEIDGKETKSVENSYLEITSHWNYKELVCIRCFGKEITVAKEDLEKAIQNATNVSR